MAECYVMLTNDHVNQVLWNWRNGKTVVSSHIFFNGSVHVCVCIVTRWPHRPASGWLHLPRHLDRAGALPCWGLLGLEFQGWGLGVPYWTYLVLDRISCKLNHLRCGLYAGRPADVERLWQNRRYDGKILKWPQLFTALYNTLLLSLGRTSDLILTNRL